MFFFSRWIVYFCFVLLSQTLLAIKEKGTDTSAHISTLTRTLLWVDQHGIKCQVLVFTHNLLIIIIAWCISSRHNLYRHYHHHRPPMFSLFRRWPNQVLVITFCTKLIGVILVNYRVLIFKCWSSSSFVVHLRIRLCTVLKPHGDHATLQDTLCEQ